MAIVDVMLPMGSVNVTQEETLASRGGFRSGQLLAQWIKETYPAVHVVGFSLGGDDDVERWFRAHTSGFFNKSAGTINSLADSVAAILAGKARRLPTPFIV